MAQLVRDISSDVSSVKTLVQAAQLETWLRREISALSPPKDAQDEQVILSFGQQLSRLEGVKHDLEGRKRRDLTDEFGDRVMRLENGKGAVVYLLGTAHVSSDSVKDVVKLIESVRPDVVVLELCKGRTAILEPPPQRPQQVGMKELNDMIKEKGQVGILYWLILYFTQHVAGQLGVMPGAEFRAAFQEAKKLRSSVLLADRPVLVTVSRAWRSLSVWEKTKLLFSMLWTPSVDEEMIEKLKQSDVLGQMVAELGIEFPSIARTLLDERDLYLSRNLYVAEGQVVVGIVGMGHMAGIKKAWGTEIDMDELSVVPPPNRTAQLCLKGVKIAIYVGLVTICWRRWGPALPLDSMRVPLGKLKLPGLRGSR